MKLQSIIVDDEQNCRDNLKILLEEYCPEMNILGLAGSASEARELVNKFSPDVVFLDIKMPKEDGFSFLSSLPNHKFSVVFITAYDDFALKAFKASAVDYLEKPIDIDELKKAVKKLVRFHGNKNSIHGNTAIQSLLEEVINSRDETIAIFTTDGFIMVKTNEIVYLEADENYTTIYLTNNKKYFSSKKLKYYEDTLNKRSFFRIHRAYMINITNHLKEFSRKEGNIAILSNNVKLPIARRILPDFLNLINPLQPPSV